MTVLEMHTGLKLRTDKIAANFAFDFLPQEKDYYLNRAVHEYIKQQYDILRKRGQKDPSYDTVADNLQTVIVQADISNFQQSQFIPSAQRVTLPNDYYHYITSHIVLNTGIRKVCYLSSYDQLNTLIPTGSNQPLFRQVPVFISSGKLDILAESQTVVYTNLSLVYIRRPATISSVNNPLDCDLPVHTHPDIVDIAANLMIQDMMDRKE